MPKAVDTCKYVQRGVVNTYMMYIYIYTHIGHSWMGSLQQSLADQRSARLYELCAVLYHAYTCCSSCVRAGHEGMFSHQHRQCHQS